MLTVTKTWRYAIQHIPVPVPSQDKLGGLRQKGIRHINGGIDGGGLLIHPNRVAQARMVGVSVSCYLAFHQKVQ